MTEIRETETFSKWLAALRDIVGRSRIVARVQRLARGNPGDVRPVGAGISELRIDHGPGYRVYFVKRGAVLVVLLCGGDKRTQASDIRAAKSLLDDMKDDDDAS